MYFNDGRRNEYLCTVLDDAPNYCGSINGRRPLLVTTEEGLG